MYYYHWSYPDYTPNYHTMPQYTYAVPTINTSYEEPYRYDESQYAYLPHQAEFIRATKDVDRVMKILKRQYRSIYREAQRGGMDDKLTEYLFRSIVRFVDDNYSSFTGTINQKVEKAYRQLQRKEPWIFEIMTLYSVSPASQARITTTVLTVAFEHLRKNPGPGAPNPR